VNHGRKHFSESRVIICGLIRDRESHIQRLKEQLLPLTKHFADYAIVIVENDSKDGTREELINWAKNDHHIHIIGCENQTNSIHSCNLSLAATEIHFLPETKRIEKMVRLRNIYLNYIDNHTLLNQFDYVIVEDFDLTSYTYLNGLFSTGFYLDNNQTIDAICSNGIFYNQVFGNLISYETYFDPYAHKDQQNQNWSMTYNDLWSSFFRKYPCDKDLIHVQSCFSGRTIYRYRSIRGKRYHTYLDHNNQAICEHVGFHQTLNKMYLNSEMIFYIVENNVLRK
jgi:glycosyltransferase involved in cell wall biosynthesis